MPHVDSMVCVPFWALAALVATAVLSMMFVAFTTLSRE